MFQNHIGDGNWYKPANVAKEENRWEVKRVCGGSMKEVSVMQCSYEGRRRLEAPACR